MRVSLDRFGPGYVALRVLFGASLAMSLTTLGLGTYSVHRGVVDLGMILLGLSVACCGAMFIINDAVRRMRRLHLEDAARAITAHYGVAVSIVALYQYLQDRQEAPRRLREAIVPLRVFGASEGTEEPVWGLRYISKSQHVELYRLTDLEPVPPSPSSSNIV